MIETRAMSKDNLTTKDLSKMLEIEKQYFLDHEVVAREVDADNSGYVYSKEDIMEMFDDCEFVVGGYQNDELVGYIALSKGNYEVGKKPDYYLYNFMVDVKKRDKKYGKILLVSAFLDYLCEKKEEFDFVTLDVEKGAKAQKLYESIGFKKFTPKSGLTGKIKGAISLIKFKIQGKEIEEDEIAMIISKDEIFDWAQKTSEELKGLYINQEDKKGENYIAEK